MSVIVAAAATFGFGFCIAAAMPSYGLFGCALVIIGLSAQTFTTTVNSTLQLSTDPEMRGRVIALFLAIAVGATPIGAPFVGWVADTFGPRWALGVGASSGFAAVLVAIHYLAKHRGLRVRLSDGRVNLSLR
jgi:MFS family permease